MVWLFLLIPVIWVVISKLIWNAKISYKECALQFVTVIPITALVFGLAYHSTLSDTQVLHGYITEKVRDNDSHQESYSCNCRNVCTGSGSNRSCSTQCDTCWRTVYSVNWYLKSTIGDIQLDYSSSYSPTVWMSRDPEIYVKAYVGEPCSQTQLFKNYIKASPRSLFNTSNYVQSTKLPVPTTPVVFDKYKVNSVLNVNTKVDISPYEDILSDHLKTLGMKKKVDIVLILANTDNHNYRYDVEKSWLGGKKNQAIFIIGTTDNKTISWVDGFTFGLSQGNMLMLTEIKDSLRGKDLNPEDIVNTITKGVEQLYKRKPMKDFEYLAKDYQPSTGILVFIFILQLAMNIGFTIFNIKHEL